mmetsp:Transcript_2396/g.4283  ORF Transcript_2396/g.4283 Transcript_2396/m.4283 type:complete len:282 (+) Transcript_2396:516-1361(+)
MQRTAIRIHQIFHPCLTSLTLLMSPHTLPTKPSKIVDTIMIIGIRTPWLLRHYKFHGIDDGCAKVFVHVVSLLAACHAISPLAATTEIIQVWLIATTRCTIRMGVIVLFLFLSINQKFEQCHFFHLLFRGRLPLHSLNQLLLPRGRLTMLRNVLRMMLLHRLYLPTSVPTPPILHNRHHGLIFGSLVLILHHIHPPLTSSLTLSPLAIPTELIQPQRHQLLLMITFNLQLLLFHINQIIPTFFENTFRELGFVFRFFNLTHHGVVFVHIHEFQSCILFHVT